MTAHRIEQLVRLLPLEATLFSPNRGPGATVPRFAECLAGALNDPAFGHRFAIEYVGRFESLPAAVYELWFRRAYLHYAGTNEIPDSIMTQVEQLVLPGSQSTRDILNALLVCQDATHAQIAGFLGLDVQVIQFYEKLHFNVRDRAADKTYMARLVYPQGRFDSLKTDGVNDLSTASRLLMAGHQFGAHEVLWLAGLNTAQTERPSVEQHLKEFVGALLQNAVQLARAGALNAKSAPGIAHAKTVLSAKRNDDSKTPTSTDPFGSSVSIGQSILLSMRHEITEEDRERSWERLKEAEALLREDKG